MKKNMQQAGTGTGHWINMLVPKNSIKICQKYMKVVEYWHGTIKNYRYDGDVSRPRKGMMWSGGRRGSGCPRGEEYEGSLVRLQCEDAVAAE